MLNIFLEQTQWMLRIFLKGNGGTIVHEIKQKQNGTRMQ